MSNVIKLETGHSKNVAEALSAAADENFDEVVIIGFDHRADRVAIRHSGTVDTLRQVGALRLAENVLLQ